MNNHFTNQKSENARLQKEIAGLKEEKKQLQDLLMALQRKITDLENIRIMSWYPLGGKGDTDKLLKNPLIEEIATKHNKSTAQIILRWHNQMGFIVIPGSRNVDHIKENFEILDFSLDEEDMF